MYVAENSQLLKSVLNEVLNGFALDDFERVLGLSPCNFSNSLPNSDIKRLFHTACRLARIEGLWWHDLRATFCTRLALAGYEALTIMSLMGHKDLKTTMRYIREPGTRLQSHGSGRVQLQRNVRSQNFGHKSPTQTERPPICWRP